MATTKQYAYYLEGSRLAIVEKDTTFDNNVDSRDFSPGIARQEWKSPTSSVANGLEIKYVLSGTENLIDETSILNLPTYLSKALVYFVKAKLAEDAGQFDMKEYLMKEFRKMIEKHETSKVSGMRITVPGSHGIR
tara:strand:- start:54 stop:458 length:405 start_codon:yes stop_codon:yes gene_type:complete